MRYWAGSSMAVVVAHLRDTPDPSFPDPASLPTFGEWQTGLTGARIELIEGKVSRAIELASAVSPRRGDTPMADHVRALDVLADALLDDGDDVAALGVATDGLAMAEQMDFGALTWRLRRMRGLALTRLGRREEGEVETVRAVREFGVLADRIADPHLRDWFRRQSHAPID
jgi:hypothetical protein